jgi:Transport and Golgi organisation 2
MCTVSFIPAQDRFFLTSNRDEKVLRLAAAPPSIHPSATGDLLFPRDSAAGGTWMAVHENGNAVVLLNGAFEKHLSAPPYRKSRGLIVLDIISNLHPLHHFLHTSLADIEPFTLVIWEEEQLYECRWDGLVAHHRLLDKHRPHIWSSVTLYDPSTIEKREQWFENWLTNQPNPDKDAILNFHIFTGDDDMRNNLLMKRDDIYSTVSVTGLQLNARSATMYYFDLLQGNTFTESIRFTKISAFS